MGNIPVKTILKELGNLKEYQPPLVGEYTLFILPDGRMMGKININKHRQILEEILGRKIITNQELVDIYVKLKIVKIQINKFNRLYININVPCTKKQKQTLKALVLSHTYEIEIVELHKWAPNAPTREYYECLLNQPL